MVSLFAERVDEIRLHDHGNYGDLGRCKSSMAVAKAGTGY